MKKMTKKSINLKKHDTNYQELNIFLLFDQ